MFSSISNLTLGSLQGYYFDYLVEPQIFYSHQWHLISQDFTSAADQTSLQYEYILLLA